ncbi:MAG: response regulator [Planctomycetia bacterium]
MTTEPCPILLVSRDLIFQSKIAGTGRELQRRVQTVGDLTAAVKRTAEAPGAVDLVILDLTSIGNPTAADVADLRAALSAGVRLMAYGAHVDVDQLKAARDGGCDPVLARSEFTRRLPELLAGCGRVDPVG